MATRFDEKEMVSSEQLMAQMIQIDAVSQLLIEKGVFSEAEFFTKLKQVQAEYQKKARKEGTINKIISGGQTGAEQAALDVAIELGIPHGGWIPKGRLTENGILPEIYQLQEMPTTSYVKRTEQNILDSDGTLIISHGKLTGGSALTGKLAKKHDRPCLHIDLNATNAFAAVKAISYWLSKHNIKVLNVAGPRLSKDPCIYDEVKKILSSVIHLNIEIQVPAPEETCIIETENNRYVVSKKEAMKLREILDKLKANYILDDVSFHGNEGAVALAKAIHNKNFWKVEKDGSIHINNPFGHSNKFKYENLKAPGSDEMRFYANRFKFLTAEEKLFLKRFK